MGTDRHGPIFSHPHRPDAFSEFTFPALFRFVHADTVPVGDVERGSRSSLRSRYGEVMPVYRRDSHRNVQAGSHDYPGEGIYLLKFDNSYSLLRNKTLYFHVYFAS